MTDPPPEAPFRVVVADDTPGIRLLMRHILEGSGAFEVVAEAVDGEQAVEQAAALQPDLVLLDLVMPRLDGLEAIPRIRASSPASRIVVLSGFTAQGMAERASDGGADGYVEKRQRPDEILRVVLEVCRSGAVPPAAPAPTSAQPSAAPATPPEARGVAATGPAAPAAATPVLGDQDLVAALARTRADLAAIGSAAAHDLKSPLQAILGFAHLLDQLYGAQLDERGAMFLRTIIDATDRMATLIDGLSTYSRAVSQRAEPAPLPLDDVMAGLTRELDGQITAAGAAVSTDPLPEVVGDLAQVRTVLRQLLLHALGAGEAGPPLSIHVSGVATSSGWSIAVRDTGPALEPEEVKARVFDLLGRVPLGANRPGAGMGLALARRLVEGWGGSISLEKEAGAGNLVVVTIPRFPPVVEAWPASAAEKTAPPAVEPPARAVPPRAESDGGPALGASLLSGAVAQLLLVEDSETHARLVAATLAEAPGPRYRLRHVADLRGARKALAEEHVDCILLDLSLPDGEGLDSLAQMRAIAAPVPIVVLTSRADEALAVAAVQQGAQDYLVKGAAEPASLGRSIRYAIERKAVESQLALAALHDALTGLPNRVLLLDRLNPALARAARSGEKIALLYLDLDDFKPINDELGHDAGDEILVEVARRLTSVIRPSDTVARLGGDEFAVLCEGFRVDAEVRALADRMAEAIADPIAVAGEERTVRASIGVAFAPSGEAAAGAEDLIRAADQAMYRQKRGEPPA